MNNNLPREATFRSCSGHDDINNFILKGVIPSIVDPLVHIFNLSLLNGVVPEGMKIAKVIPLYKKGDKLDVNNYRPISLLTTLSKILEKKLFTKELLPSLNPMKYFQIPSLVSGKIITPLMHC